LINNRLRLREGKTFLRRSLVPQFRRKNMEPVIAGETSKTEERPAGSASAAPPPNPSRIFQLINAFMQSAALKAAIELEIFTGIGEGLTTSDELAMRAGAAERGVRILCDYLTVQGLLTKRAGQYGLAPDAAMFLDRRSPAYMGSAVHFLNAPENLEAYRGLTTAVRKGGTVLDGGTIVPDNPLWVEFARSMAPMMMMPAQAIAKIVRASAGDPVRVLDIAAGHGLFGITIARQNPRAQITALDWPNVLEVALENARQAGVGNRFTPLPGSAFDVEFGGGYDLVLITNFLHHFDPPTCETLLRKVRAALGEGGRAVTLDMVPNDDRITPPDAAAFSMIMLGTTPRGDAYTFMEFQRMFRNAGFQHSELTRLDNPLMSVIVSTS
jgi:ubiquinone/menaquinone biosynthesis C-methylase UbiE